LSLLAGDGKKSTNLDLLFLLPNLLVAVELVTGVAVLAQGWPVLLILFLTVLAINQWLIKPGAMRTHWKYLRRRQFYLKLLLVVAAHLSLPALGGLFIWQLTKLPASIQ
jgi:hypothetical protein